MSENKAYDVADWLRDSAPSGPLGRRMVEAAAEIARLRTIEAAAAAVSASSYVDSYGDWRAGDKELGALFKLLPEPAPTA